MLMSVGRVHQLFGLEALRPAILAGGLALLLYFADAYDERRIATVWAPTTKWLAALFAWMVLSVPGSLSEGTAVMLVFDNFVKTAAMFLVTVAAVRGLRDVERLAAVYLASASLYAAVVVLRFDLGSGDDWRLGHLYYYDANDFATFAVTAAPFGLYFLHAARSRLTRLLACAALTVLSAAFVYSGSRGGFLALSVVSTFVVLCYRAVPLRWRMSATALVAVVLIGVASEQYWRQMGTILSDVDYNRTGETGRLQIWSRGIGYMWQHPVFGVGPDNFPVAEGLLSPHASRQQFGVGVRWSAAHNSLVQVGAELGLPGLTFFVGMIGSAFLALRRTSRAGRARHGRARGVPELAQAIEASLLGFAVGAFFLSLAYAEMLYTLLALAVAVRKVSAPAR
jgi:O-antigen ligase